jgi:hypothetical protein
VCLHELDGPHDPTDGNRHGWVVVGLVVEEATGDLVAELVVRAGVENEGVPADVDELGRREAFARGVGAELEESEGSLHDLLGDRASNVLVLDDPTDESVEQFGRDKLAVRHHHFGWSGHDGSRHCRPPWYYPYGRSARNKATIQLSLYNYKLKGIQSLIDQSSMNRCATLLLGLGADQQLLISGYGSSRLSSVEQV